MTNEERDDLLDVDDEIDDEEEDTGLTRGGGPAATWQGGEIGEDEARRDDTEHGVV